MRITIRRYKVWLDDKLNGPLPEVLAKNVSQFFFVPGNYSYLLEVEFYDLYSIDSRNPTISLFLMRFSSFGVLDFGSYTRRKEGWMGSSFPTPSRSILSAECLPPTLASLFSTSITQSIQHNINYHSILAPRRAASTDIMVQDVEVRVVQPQLIIATPFVTQFLRNFPAGQPVAPQYINYLFDEFLEPIKTAGRLVIRPRLEQAIEVAINCYQAQLDYLERHRPGPHELVSTACSEVDHLLKVSMSPTG